MPLPIRAILFDLDGTLLDTVLDLHAAADAMLADLERPALSVLAIRSYVGRGIPNLVKRVLAGDREAADDPRPPPSDALASFRKHYAHFNGKRALAFPGVMEGLNAFRAAGLPMGVVTNKAHTFTVPLLERTGLAPYMSVTVSGDTLPRAKPDPMPLIWACGKLGISPAETLMIGDSVHDFTAARAAGCPVFLVPYGYNEGRDVRELACDAIVSTLSDGAALVLDRRPASADS
jgi:phosphoglycolate phosphatase